MSAPSPLLLLLLLLLLCTDRTTGDDHLHGTEEEPREEHFDELKWMLRTRLQRMARRVGRGERPKAAGAAIVAVDPIFLDLDNIESFNDISSFDTTTVASTTTKDTSAATTSGPLIIGVDAQGRNILRFMSNWESEMASLAPRIPTTTTEANTTTSTTLRTSIETTTAEPLTETTAPSTTPVTTVMSTRTSTMSMTTTPMETTTEATTTRTEAPSTLPTTTITMESTAQTTTTPIATTSSEGETKKMETTATEEPAFIQTSGSFERNNGLEENFMEETTLRSVRADTIQPLVEETVDPEDQIWWTPKPSFLGMSSILTMEQNDEKIEEETTAWKPLWASKREPITSTTTSTTTATTEATTTIGFYPKINRRNEGRRFMTKLEKVAEQSVINDLELLAGSMNMKELVSELRGEQKLPQVMDPKQTDVALAIKKKTLSQLEMLQRLAERKGELEELIKTQRKILSQARGLRTRIVTGGAEENEEDGRKAVNNVINEGRFLETPAPTTTAAPEAVFSPLWQRQLKKRKESKQKRRPRQRQTMSLHHFVGVPPRGPTKMIDNEITPSVVELTEILEREMRQTQREVLSQEMRQFCSQALCTFERGDMCHYETSYDELTRRRLQQKRRSRREAASSPIYVIRSWSNWFGQPNQNNIRIDKAPLFSSRNSRFAAVFLEPQQLASLSLSVSTRGPFTIRFRGWEATTGVRLRVCCDDYCPFSTDIGRSRKRWRNHSVDCPSDTHQIAFECENMGNRKGVCGIDDVFIAAEGCPSLFDGSADL